MAANDPVARALRIAAAEVAGIEPHPDDVAPNLAQTVGYKPQVSYDDYLRHINSANLPAFRASGAHYSPAGAREGYEEYGLPPVIQQRSPFATAAFRTFVDPFGQMMVQPLVGFPSAYPHVLSGVPTNPMYGFGMAAQLGPLTWPIAYPPSAPFMQQPAARSGATARRTAAPRSTQLKQPTPAGQHWVHPESNPNVNPGNYVLVPDDFSQAALHPAYEGQLRANANWNAQGAVTLPPATTSARQSPQPAIDYPWMHYQDPWPSIFPKSAPAPQVAPPAPQAAPALAPVPGLQAPVSGATVNPDGSWVGGTPPPEYNFRQGQTQQVPVPRTAIPEFTVPGGQPFVPQPGPVAMLPSSVVRSYYG